VGGCVVVVAILEGGSHPCDCNNSYNHAGISSPVGVELVVVVGFSVVVVCCGVVVIVMFCLHKYMDVS
jgi:hypothetical protein